MTDPELRELTASEPLSEEDEYAMQRVYLIACFICDLSGYALRMWCFPSRKMAT